VIAFCDYELLELKIYNYVLFMLLSFEQLTACFGLFPC